MTPAPRLSMNAEVMMECEQQWAMQQRNLNVVALLDREQVLLQHTPAKRQASR